jgi:large subunit ribosomal protein L15
MNNLNSIKVIKRTKRLGRGPASGKGKTSGRGMTGQKSRTGAKTSRIEGGQTKLIMRLPKAGGFKRSKRPTSLTLTTDQLNSLFKDGGEIKAADIIKKLKLENKGINKVKIIQGRSELAKIKISPDITVSKSLSPDKKINQKPEKQTK